MWDTSRQVHPRGQWERERREDEWREREGVVGHSSLLTSWNWTASLWLFNRDVNWVQNRPRFSPRRSYFYHVSNCRAAAAADFRDLGFNCVVKEPHQEVVRSGFMFVGPWNVSGWWREGRHNKGLKGFFNTTSCLPSLSSSSCPLLPFLIVISRERTSTENRWWFMMWTMSLFWSATYLVVSSRDALDDDITF